MVQSVLSRPVAEIPELEACDFDADFRLGELITLLAIHETRDAIHPIDDLEMRIYPAWQSRFQKTALESATGKGSWDGFLVGVPKDVNDTKPIVVPVEIKSTARDPLVPVDGSPAEQLEKTVARFEEFFQTAGTINCVLLYPYTDEKDLVLDIERAVESIRTHISERSLGVVCLMSFVEHDRQVTVEIICAFIAPHAAIEAHGHRHWLRRVIF